MKRQDAKIESRKPSRGRPSVSGSYGDRLIIYAGEELKRRVTEYAASNNQSASEYVRLLIIQDLSRK